MYVRRRVIVARIRIYYKSMYLHTWIGGRVVIRDTRILQFEFPNELADRNLSSRIATRCIYRADIQWFQNRYRLSLVRSQIYTRL